METPIRLRIATLHHLEGPSSRLRVYGPLAWTCARSAHEPVAPAVHASARWAVPDWAFRLGIGCAALERTGGARRPLGRGARALLGAHRRMGAFWVAGWLLTGTRPDDVVLLEGLLPPGWVTRRLAQRCRRLVYDFDDSVYLLSARAERRWAAVTGAAHLVITTNRANREAAEGAGATVSLLTTPVDTRRLRPRPPAGDAARPEAHRPLRVAWVGSPSTTPYLEAVVRDLERLEAGADVEFLFIGATPFPSRLRRVRFVPWSERAEEVLLPTADAGLMPLPPGPWAEGKGGYKTLQYMACGLPTVASDVGPGRLLVEHGVTGLLVPPGGDWVEPLRALLADAGLRARMGLEARERAERLYSLDALAERWAELVLGPAARGAVQTEAVVLERRRL